MAVKKEVIEEPKKPENLVQAICQVMREVKNIEKNLSVGEGKSSYKGVADKDVKHLIGQAMERAGLVVLPTNIEPSIKIERWEEQTNYGVKVKQSIFTEVKTTYMLMHESGQAHEFVGYGHGVDSQDKSAGKATTYALKYALLYLFMVPTGSIDDADNTHSEKLEVKTVTPVAPAPAQLNETEFMRLVGAINGNKLDKDGNLIDVEWAKSRYKLNDNQLNVLMQL